MKKRIRPDTSLRNWKHGYALSGGKHPIYRAWTSMISRCRTNSGPDFHNYKARGIKVCKRWQVFKNFLKDMLESFQKGLTIERKNNNRGYSPKNCVWATRQQQNLNKRNLRLITHKGETLPASEWAKRLGGNTDIVYVRMRRGWTPQRAVSTPAGLIGSNGSKTIPR